MPHTIFGFSAPRRARFGCRCAPHALARPALFCLLLTGLFLTAAPATRAQVTLLVPSAPSVEAPPRRADKAEAWPQATKNAPRAEAQPDARPREDKKNPEQKPAGPTTALPAAAGAPAPAATNATLPASAGAPAGTAAAEEPRPGINAEVDVLITMLRPFQYEGLVMDMPQLFAVLRYDNATPLKEGHPQPERRDLLGDVEEIRYLNQKAWGANVALNKSGLYQFIIEARPWWDAARQRFVQHYVKTILPVYGIERGWDAPVGQRFEIVPRTRPFGLVAPVLFSGQVRLEGKPLPNALVRMRRINMERNPVPTPWHEELVARADNQGALAFVLGQPGWWCCQAEAEGAPLKGPNGQPRPLDMGALLWLFVDAPPAAPRQR